MAFPVRPLVRPACLAGQANGRLPDSILVSTPGQAGGAVVRLVEPAARAWRALTAAALAAGHVLKPTSAADSYRVYSIQERIFRQRYTTTPLAGRPRKMWERQWWYQRPGTAVAAVPGTSNHGWALAVDTGEERDSDAGTESLDSPTLNWLLANEQTYGWSHEVQSEPWHLRYFAGDVIPAAVLAYEHGHDLPAPAPEPVNEEERMFLARCKGTAEVWLIEAGRMSHVESAADQAQIATALGLPAGEAEVSLASWEHLINGRKQYRNS